MTCKYYFIRRYREDGEGFFLSTTLLDIEGNQVECFAVDYTLADSESDDSQNRNEFYFSTNGFYDWNGYRLKKVTDKETVNHYLYILDNLGLPFIVD